MKNIRYCCMRAIAVTILVITAFVASAQNDRQYIRNGNKLFRQQNYPKAEAEYRKALAQNHSNTQAAYNLGCALMQQQKDSAAIVQFENVGKAEKSQLRKSMAYHNIGVICQKHQMFSEAIEAYKESLRNNPSDNETRYNLELCKRQLKNQNGGSNKNKEKEDKNKEQQKEQSDKQDNKKNDDKQKQKQQPQQQMSKENAEQMLNAAMQEEKATQQKLKSKMQQQQSRKLDNNW